MATTSSSLQPIACVVPQAPPIGGVAAGFPVIVDGTFLDRRVRNDFRRLARQLEVPFVILDCVADLRELRRRLLARESDGLDASEADVGVMEQQRKKMELLSDSERKAAIEVDSGAGADALWEAVSRRLAGQAAHR